MSAGEKGSAPSTYTIGSERRPPSSLGEVARGCQWERGAFAILTKSLDEASRGLNLNPQLSAARAKPAGCGGFLDTFLGAEYQWSSTGL